MTNPDLSPDLGPQPQLSINPELIHEMVAAGNAQYLISLFDFLQRSRHRAERLAQVYLNQMEVLHQRLREARGEAEANTRPTAGAIPVRGRADSKPKAEAAVPKVPKSQPQALDIEL